MHFCAIFSKAELNASATLFQSDFGSFSDVKPLANSNMRESGGYLLSCPCFFAPPGFRLGLIVGREQEPLEYVLNLIKFPCQMFLKCCQNLNFGWTIVFSNSFHHCRGRLAICLMPFYSGY